MPTLIVGLAGAVIGSFMMMLYAGTHFGTATGGPSQTPPAIAAAPLTGVSDQDRIVNAVKRTKPSVVAITEEVNGQQVVPIDPFFGQNGPGIVQPFRGKASGSGFVFDTQGDIVTNAHVVTAPSGGQISKLTVIFNNGDSVPAHVIATNLGVDLAVIRVDHYAKLPPPLELGDSDRLEEGQWAIAIGEPYQLQHTVTLGIVSAFHRDEQVQVEGGPGLYNFKNLLQTSAPINPGNSGGPLIDIDGRVIGVNQLTNEAAQGIGFAIPSNIVKTTIPELIKNPGVHQGTGVGFAGFTMAQLTNGFKNQIGYTGTDGVAVVNVYAGTPADKAGLNGGDVILQADAKSFSTPTDLSKYIASKKPGDVLRLQVWSQGVKKMVAVTLEERPANANLPQQQP